jgi:hypothetical protein
LSNAIGCTALELEVDAMLAALTNGYRCRLSNANVEQKQAPRASWLAVNGFVYAPPTPRPDERHDQASTRATASSLTVKTKGKDMATTLSPSVAHIDVKGKGRALPLDTDSMDDSMQAKLLQWRRATSGKCRLHSVECNALLC